MYPISIGTHHMRTSHTNRFTPELPTPYAAVVPHYVKCFSEYLRAAGYYCSNNVKTDYQFEPPLTAWDELSETAHWRHRPDPDQPFFAVFNPTNTHESAMWEGTGTEIRFDPSDMRLPPYFPDTPKVRESMSRMYSQIERSDQHLGEILDQLEADGLAENTIIFHWSDHGPLPRGKRWLYDSGIHVPLIVRWPRKIEPNSVSDQMVSTIDLGPTVLSAAGIKIPYHMQGRAFLGEQAKPQREFIFAARDRFDESYDMVRAVRDQHFKYIRNYHPELPYLLWIPFRNRHPIMQEMWRMHMAGELNEVQSLMFQTNRPVEELYDTRTDPYEIENLADNPVYTLELAHLRRALDEWLVEVGDLGKAAESEMVRSWYPDGVQPKTAAPVPIPICQESMGVEAAPEGGAFTAPVLLQLHCATQGASIAYTTQTGDSPHWLLYSGPIRLPVGKTTVRARAVRIGYQDSADISVNFKVKAVKKTGA
jgi:hypothetical protein